MPLNKIFSQIKRLHIQGATAIAKKGVMAFAEYVAQGNNLEKDIEYAKSKLMSARPTEPMLFNAMEYVIKNSKTREDFIKYAKEFVRIKEESEKKIAEYGASLIKNGTNVFTHCHSSSVIRIFKKAKEQGKDFNVICFETRPLYQGRVTARELVKLGIRTTLTIDSAMTEAFEVYPPSAVFVGCDAITKTFIVNKIGTDTLAHAAKGHNVPFYVCTETFKYTDSLKIEERDPDEVWKSRPKGLNIWNPAFDTVSNRFITNFITEKGIVRRVRCSGL